MTREDISKGACLLSEIDYMKKNISRWNMETTEFENGKVSFVLHSLGWSWYTDEKEISEGTSLDFMVYKELVKCSTKIIIRLQDRLKQLEEELEKL